MAMGNSTKNIQPPEILLVGAAFDGPGADDPGPDAWLEGGLALLPEDGPLPVLEGGEAPLLLVTLMASF